MKCPIIAPKPAEVEGRRTTLQYVRCEDWFIFATDPEGNLYSVCTELWEEWLDFPDGADTTPDAVERWMLPIAFTRWATLPWRQVGL